MNVELYIDGQLADLDKKDFAYTLQVNNMFDFDTREFSYSDVLYLPTTPTNRHIFEYADVPTSVSKGAYKRYSVDFYVNGIAIVLKANGFLMGKRGDRFIFDFKDNSKDIFQLMIGKKLKDLPLEQLKHDKSLSTINDLNFGEDNRAVIYAAADYGGETIKKIDGVDYYNYDYCPPSVQMDWILQKIKELNPRTPYIFKSNFFESNFWKSLFMTVSDGKVHNIIDGETLFNKSGDCQGNSGFQDYSVYWNENNQRFEGSYTSTPFFVIPESGKYIIDIKGNVRGELYFNRTLAHSGSFDSFHKINFENQEYEFTEGDKLYITAVGYPEEEDRTGQGGIILQGDNTEILDLTVKVYRAKDVDFKELFSDISVIDWFKEVMKLFALTPIKDDKTNNIQQFYTLSERVNNAPVLDWSDKFIKVTEEKYHDTSAYAQVNKFKYSKYDEQSNQQDGNDFDLIFNDPAIIFEKEFKSKFFLGIPFSSEVIVAGDKLDKLLFFDKEVKEKNGKTEIEYKPQNNRFHIFKMGIAGLVLNGCLNNGAEKGAVVPLVAESQLLRWENLLKNYYKDLPRLMENLHLVTCEFNLSEVGIHSFSFYSRIYVEQLGAYFLPNKIIYKAEKPAIVEMIKIKPINH